MSLEHILSRPDLPGQSEVSVPSLTSLGHEYDHVTSTQSPATNFNLEFQQVQDNPNPSLLPNPGHDYFSPELGGHGLEANRYHYYDLNSQQLHQPARCGNYSRPGHLANNTPANTTVDLFADQHADSSDSDTSPAQTRVNCLKFTVADLRELISALIDVNPFMANHGQKCEMWAKVTKLTKDNGGCVNHSEASMRKKVWDLIAYQEVYLCDLFRSRF